MNAKLFAAAPALLVLGLPVPSSGPPAPAPAAAATYEVDTTHSGVLFRVKHVGVSYFHGRFNDIQGTYELDTEDMTGSSVDVQIQAASVDTANENRDGHLRSADFFDVEQFPVIEFESTGIEAGSKEDHYELKGELTLHGVTKPIEAELLFFGEGPGPRGRHRSGFEARFTIQRGDFGMRYGLDNGGLGNEVDVTVFVEGVRQEE